MITKLANGDYEIIYRGSSHRATWNGTQWEITSRKLENTEGGKMRRYDNLFDHPAFTDVK